MTFQEVFREKGFHQVVAKKIWFVTSAVLEKIIKFGSTKGIKTITLVQESFQSGTIREGKIISHFWNFCLEIGVHLVIVFSLFTQHLDNGVILLPSAFGNLKSRFGKSIISAESF